MRQSRLDPAAGHFGVIVEHLNEGCAGRFDAGVGRYAEVSPSGKAYDPDSREF
jgi:hypothetical protein